MRIAITTWSRRGVGGTETYLENIAAALVERGHEVGFWHEVDAPAARPPVALPQGVPVWGVCALGRRGALDGLRAWRPDIIYGHGMLDPRLEAATLDIAPGVFFAHGYYGTCISGAKTFKRPVVRPCHRRFGWKCLVYFYPRRCGGLSPVTMVVQYLRQSRRLRLLHRYKAIVTHSEHMAAEYAKHGLPAGRSYQFAYVTVVPGVAGSATAVSMFRAAPVATASWRLLFLGRMEFLKGGLTLIEALPQAAAGLDRPLRVTLGGDGPDRARWQAAADALQRRTDRVRIDFVGWTTGAERDALFADADLLVFPSLWPEPFGLVGPEAGLCGVPAVAFDVGGISNWLTDGVNGGLAPGDPPSAAGLASAIIRCLGDPAAYARLRRGAHEVARRFKIETHIASLETIFERVTGER